MIKVVCKAKLKPGVKVEEYLIIAREVVSETRKEKGCITYTLYEDINDPTILTTLEESGDKRLSINTIKMNMFGNLLKSLENFEKVQKLTFIEK